MKAFSKIIILVGVTITVIWGLIGCFGGWKYSWIAVFITVMISAGINIYLESRKDKQDKEINNNKEE